MGVMETIGTMGTYRSNDIALINSITPPTNSNRSYDFYASHDINLIIHITLTRSAISSVELDGNYGMAVHIP